MFQKMVRFFLFGLKSRFFQIVPVLFSTEGIVSNPGYAGSNGKIISIRFRAKDVGYAQLSIRSGSVLANDGQGTQILEDVDGATITIVSNITGPTAPNQSPQAF